MRKPARFVHSFRYNTGSGQTDRQPDGRTTTSYIKDSPYSITERVPELIPILGSQPAGDVSHKPGGRLPLLSARPAVTLATLAGLLYQFRCLVNRGTMGVNSLPKTVTRQRRDCDLNPGPTAPESNTLTTRLPSHPDSIYRGKNHTNLFRHSKDVDSQRTHSSAVFQASILGLYKQSLVSVRGWSAYVMQLIGGV